MSNRYTKKHVHNQFVRLCDALGKKVANSYNDKGAWALDCYQGVKIVEYLPNGGESEPFGSTRYSNREFYDMVNFTLRCLAIDRGQADHIYWPTDKITNRVNN